MPSLIEYLQKPNPDITSKASDKEAGDQRPITGTSNSSPFSPSITGLRKWEEFNLDTVEACYRKALHAELPYDLPRIQPALTPMGTQIWDEDCLRILFARTIMAQVTAALNQSYRHCYGDKEDPIEIHAGGFAKIKNNNDITQADWAGVRSSVVQQNYRSYWNLCPGLVKISSKWTSGDQHSENWEQPWSQIQTCCGVHWRTRYGYILTDEELVVIRVRRSKTPASTDSVAFDPIDFRRIAYSAHGKGRLTVKLGLWFLHMIASAPSTDSVLRHSYAPLHSYIKANSGGGFRHLSTGLGRSTLPTEAVGYDSMSTVSGFGDPGAGEKHQALAQMLEIYCEDVRKVKWLKEDQQWLIKTFQSKGEYYLPGTPRLRSKKDGRWYRLRHKGIESYDWGLDE